MFIHTLTYINVYWDYAIYHSPSFQKKCFKENLQDTTFLTCKACGSYMCRKQKRRPRRCRNHFLRSSQRQWVSGPASRNALANVPYYGDSVLGWWYLIFMIFDIYVLAWWYVHGYRWLDDIQHLYGYNLVTNHGYSFVSPISWDLGASKLWRWNIPSLEMWKIKTFTLW